MNREIIEKKIELLGNSFVRILHEQDVNFLEGMKDNNLAGDDVRKYLFWEWTQGVGLYGFWKLYKHSSDKKYLDILLNYYDERLAEGLPAKNINTMAPMLTLAFLYEHTGKKQYLEVCLEWVEWIMKELPRTEEGGFQHITSDSINPQELWDDTLFMTVLFLAKMGDILDRREYIDEASYQFLIHIKFLADKHTGLWYHGWTFEERDNFAGAFWGRGNCWATIAIPEFIEMVDINRAIRKYLEQILTNQVKTLEELQNPDGFWHTLIDDDTSYAEASATAGFAYGILKAVEMGILDEHYRDVGLKATKGIIDMIDDKGLVNQVSYGTPMGRESREFYKTIPIKPMPYGQALAMLNLVQVYEV